MAKRSMVLVSFLAEMLSVAAPAMTQEGPRFTAPPADERLSRTRLRGRPVGSSPSHASESVAEKYPRCNFFVTRAIQYKGIVERGRKEAAMAKRLAVLVAALAGMLATAVPALAQEGYQ